MSNEEPEIIRQVPIPETDQSHCTKCRGSVTVLFMRGDDNVYEAHATFYLEEDWSLFQGDAPVEEELQIEWPVVDVTMSDDGTVRSCGYASPADDGIRMCGMASNPRTAGSLGEAMTHAFLSVLELDSCAADIRVVPASCVPPNPDELIPLKALIRKHQADIQNALRRYGPDFDGDTDIGSDEVVEPGDD